MEKNALSSRCRLAVIGGSAGSLEVLLQVVAQLDSVLTFPILVVLHRKNAQDNVLADLLAGKTQLIVKEAEEKDFLQPGYIYLVPSDYHLLIENDFTISLDVSEKVHFSRPSIDITFESAAAVCGSALCCILLSGANADGVHGLSVVQKHGGIVAVQDPTTAMVPYMPQQAMNAMHMNYVLGVKDIAQLLNRLSSLQ
jgi:two-component system, chemotaxis family, protein-glutamate methylesterase/glutaminase